jgi:hypothetical protein
MRNRMQHPKVKFQRTHLLVTYEKQGLKWQGSGCNYTKGVRLQNGTDALTYIKNIREIVYRLNKISNVLGTVHASVIKWNFGKRSYSDAPDRWWSFATFRLCGLVIRVPGYRSRGPGSFSALPDFLSSGSGTEYTQPREYYWEATWKKK